MAAEAKREEKTKAEGFEAAEGEKTQPSFHAVDAVLPLQRL